MAVRKRRASAGIACVRVRIAEFPYSPPCIARGFGESARACRSSQAASPVCRCIAGTVCASALSILLVQSASKPIFTNRYGRRCLPPSLWLPVERRSRASVPLHGASTSEVTFSVSTSYEGLAFLERLARLTMPFHDGGLLHVHAEQRQLQRQLHAAAPARMTSRTHSPRCSHRAAPLSPALASRGSPHRGR